jgi:hypothetical protein
MRQTPAGQLLDGWETFRGQPMPVRAAALAALFTGQSLAEAMRWSVPRRDRVLFDCRAQVFGDRVEAVTSCPACGEQLEMHLAPSQIAPSKRDTAASSTFRSVRIGGSRVRCRLPNSEDLLAVASLTDIAEAREQLIGRCVQSDDPDLREQAAALLAHQADDVHLNLTCPACGHAWQTGFDIAAFVWRELDDWAERTLHEIHMIASAYGWSESEILELSARRRQTYVEMI